MTLGLAERQGRLGNVAVQRCEAELPQQSIYRLLHAERDRSFHPAAPAITSSPSSSHHHRIREAHWAPGS